MFSTTMLTAAISHVTHFSASQHQPFYQYLIAKISIFILLLFLLDGSAFQATITTVPFLHIVIPTIVHIVHYYLMLTLIPIAML